MGLSKTTYSLWEVEMSGIEIAGGIDGKVVVVLESKSGGR